MLHRTKAGKGKWKRLKGKENVVCLIVGNHGNNSEKGGLKRQWHLRDENSDSEISLDSIKRLKGHEDCRDDTSMEVGVANLKWPQVDQ